MHRMYILHDSIREGIVHFDSCSKTSDLHQTNLSVAAVTYKINQRRQSGLKSWGSWIRLKKFNFSKQISEKIRFFQGKF